MLFHKITSTSLGIGYIGKGAGTAAAAVTCLVWYFVHPDAFNFIPALIVTGLLTVLGIWSGNVVEAIWGKDHNRVVIDEVVGMCITLLWIPVTPVNILIGLILFRFFDILKPLFIRRLENLPGGWGVMFDDILAGIYANIVLQIILRFIIH
ncbi:phosphatidylglycerophosphatase A [Pedobacter cryoconitis]|uniref:Phosphatidylglycerophosphatase A n=1 Tax=Pedobacter cryoconitis TaxID=188932 RepID=A0A7X0J5Q6_9SPHI|nr:phosphatidylglycerophosphatase A [Pedobacter cryoconitis]MBB6501614.1 phosphatidylglycerophosphatase A [Pedobacter cryoconitis]